MQAIYVHFGYHKTGSSSFQKSCAAKAEKQEAQGFKFHCDQTDYGDIENHSIPIYSSFGFNLSDNHINQCWGIRDPHGINRNYLGQLSTCLDSEFDVLISGQDNSLLSINERQAFKRTLQPKNRPIRHPKKPVPVLMFCGSRRNHEWPAKGLESVLFAIP